MLVGHPNVGKSALFNRLTGADITESNYPGTTVDYTEGELLADGRSLQVIDVPGTFSLDPKDRAEEVAVELLEANPGATVVCVVDATRIERGLNLALEVIERGYEVVLAVNMWDEAREKNIDIDVDGLEEMLGVPVTPTIATAGVGIKDLVESLSRATAPSIEDIERRASTEVLDA
ncbi:Ferrous iron transport protein B [Halanaeroarchaeum sulfurireducens]|uniref:Ferrous iron transport protein B n=1 Tax=Halanaeroarchaeum sulfurireducens TaxID=1604004 RepID=A0A0F7P7A4_9EURY|nr:Ferrous iron transport protein B [Halanaeroarchaeum sulfurireducens]ALG80979.1 Ferrous iron transport protein B [Halanaeroarchaeum sulfurireducens]